MKTSPGKFNQVNSLYFDEYGRPNGILLIDKPAGVTSHDIVDVARRALGVRKVGHAGALDVFSSGLLLILVGKATKFSNEFLTQDKAYEARVIFGIETTTQDPEGEVVRVEPQTDLTQARVEQVLGEFAGGYEQYVSIFSSVKVEGKKLRKVLRDPAWTYHLEEFPDKKILHFANRHDPEKKYTLDVPHRPVKIYEIRLIDFGKLKAPALPFKNLPDADAVFYYADVHVKCSKGTYIRQLAEDIGRRLGSAAALANLKRTELGQWKLTDTIKAEDIASFASPKA
jgi:tRNA pseudouridine55 synthase